MNPKTIKAIGIAILFVILAIVTYNYSPDSSNSSSSPSSTSGLEYCRKHDRSYNPNNAWKGCPDCVKEQDIKNTEKSREKFNRL